MSSRQTANVATAGSTSTATWPVATSNPPQPRRVTIFCWILGVSTSEFPVDIEDSLSVGHLKDAIVKKNSNAFLGVDAAQLMLWKVSIQISRKLKDRVNEHQFLEETSLLAGELLEEIFPPPQPSEKTLHIVVRPPSDSTITASQSSDSNLAAYITLKRPRSPDYLDSTKRARGDDAGWLSELHGKIWNRKDRLQELLHTVEITMAHYNELQERLDKLCPNRHTQGYIAASKSVLSTKLDVLRNFQPPLAAPAPELPAHADNEQAENNEEEENNDDDKPHSIFPVTITYLDLSCLQLEDMTLRMPPAFLIRDEYRILDDIVDRLQGSGIISGQPGTGKTTYIYFRMIWSMINGEPFLYQSLGGTVYHVSDIVATITSLPSGSADIVAYVDANEKKFEPQMFIRRPWIKIIAASSPSGTDQPWLKQMGNIGFPLTFATALWTDTELFITGIFFHPLDLTYARLKEATTYFGFSPCLCFNASCEDRQFRELQNKVKMAVKRAALKRDIKSLIFSYENSMMLSHTIFELSPQDNDRLFGDALIGTVSLWALDLLLEAYEAQKSDAAFEFYEAITDIPKAGSLRGRILERQVLRYFDNLKGPHTFILRSLKDNSIINWVYPGPTKRHMFQPTTFPKELQSAVSNKQSLHLVPKDSNFPALDSIVYDPKPEGGLSLNQITANLHHPVAVVGLQHVRRWLKQNTSLAHLRPSIQCRHWPFIFIVPETISDSFTKQLFEEDTITQEWAKKVDQYVLGIEEESLWARTR